MKKNTLIRKMGIAMGAGLLAAGLAACGSSGQSAARDTSRQETVQATATPTEKPLEAAGVLLADAVELPVSEDGSEGSVPPEQPTSSNPIASRSGSSRLQRLRFLVY